MDRERFDFERERDFDDLIRFLVRLVAVAELRVADRYGSNRPLRQSPRIGSVCV